MRLPAEVAGGRGQHVVGEHRGELRPHGAKGPGHRGIHRTRAEVGAVELVHDPGQPRELGAQHIGIGVGTAEIIALQLVTGIEAGRIPAKRDSLRLGAPDRLGDPEVLTHVVEDELLASRTADGVGQRVDVVNGALQILRMMPRLVHQLDEEDRRLVFQRDVRVRVHVIQDLAQVIHLRRERRRVGAHAAFTEAPAESRSGRVAERVGPVGAVELNRAEQHGDAALCSTSDEIVQEIQVIVGDEIARAVRRFPVAPEREP